MQSNHHRARIAFAASCLLALAAAACAQQPGESSGGTGGTDQALLPSAGAGGGGASAPVATATGGTTVVATGGAPAIAQATGGSAAIGPDGAETEVPGSGGAPGPETQTDAGSMTPVGRADLGKGDGSDVLTIGDSWMNILTNGGGIEGGLDRAGTSYHHEAIAGTTLINGDIPAQYGRATAGGAKFATVIMTGGGNDVMFSGGCNTKEACTESVKMIVSALDELWTKMADEGVSDVVYIQYSKNVGTAPSDTRPDTPPDPPTICLSGRIKCHTINTTDLVGPTDSIDGIHPTLAACDLIAARVLDDLEMTGARR